MTGATGGGLREAARRRAAAGLLDGLGHEINQALTAIASFAGACETVLATRDPEVAEPARTWARRIGEEAVSAARILGRHRRFTDDPRVLEVLGAMLAGAQGTAGEDARVRVGVAPAEGGGVLTMVHSGAAVPREELDRCQEIARGMRGTLEQEAVPGAVRVRLFLPSPERE